MLLFERKSKPVRQVDNAKDWPKEYSCNFLEAGVVSYKDVGQGVAYLRKETIQNMLPSFIGKPILIDHHDVTPETFAKKAVGYVTRAWFNEQDGWFWCTFLVDDDKAKELIAKGYSVSCAFDVVGTAPGGEWHNIKYDEELTNCSFTHLALVSSPRYEECKIYMNSKGMGTMKKNGVLEDTLVDLQARLKKLKQAGDKDAAEGVEMQIAEVQKQIKSRDNVSIDKDEEEQLKEFQGSKEEFTILERDRMQTKNCPCGSGKTVENCPCGAKKNKNKENKIMFGLKKKAKENEKLDASRAFVVVDGERVPLKTLLNSVESVEVSTEETIVIDGQEVAVADLVTTYQNAKKKKDVKKDTPEDMEEDKENEGDDEEEKENTSMAAKPEKLKTKSDAKKKKMDDDKDEAEADDKEHSKDEDEEKENDDDEEKKETKKDKKDNTKHFSRISSARENGDEAEEGDGFGDSLSGRVARGNSRYSSTKR